MESSRLFEYDIGEYGPMDAETWTLFDEVGPMSDDWLPFVLSPLSSNLESGVEEHCLYQSHFPASPETESTRENLSEILTNIQESEVPNKLKQRSVVTVKLVKPPKGWKAPIPTIKTEKQPTKYSCCVMNCSNSPQKCIGQGIKFHSFPGRAYEKERKEMWVAALNQVNPDGTPWRPAKHSKVCSAHFVGGTVSNIATHPAYIPTIFPPVSSNARK